MISSKIKVLLFLGLSALFSYLFVVPGHFPSFSVSLIFSGLATLVFAFKKNKSKISLALFLLILTLSTFITIRANGFLVFLNTVSAFFFGAVLISYPGNLHKFIAVLLLPFSTSFKILLEANKYPLSLLGKKDVSKSRVERDNLLISVLLSILVLGVIIPLLASANPLFGRWLESILNILKLRNLLNWFNAPNILLNILRGIFFMLFMLILPRLTSLVEGQPRSLKTQDMYTNNYRDFLTLPKITVVIILIIFFIFQAQLYFASSATLADLGLTYSQYAREVFAHLLVVTGVIYVLIYNDRKKSKTAKILTLLLIIEVLFLDMMALKSVNEYSRVWGFTYKRLWGFTGVLWVFGAYFIFLRNYLSQKRQEALIVNTLLFSGLVLIGVNIVNFDYLIYRYAKARTGQGVDQMYLSTLSSDARAYKKQLDVLMAEFSGKKDIDWEKLSAAYMLLNQIENIRQKYQTFDFRWFNFSEYQEYKNLKDFSLTQTKNEIEKLQRENESFVYPEGLNSYNKLPEVTITITDLPENFLNHTLEIQNPNGTSVKRGKLTGNQFQHQFGEGKFKLVILRFDELDGHEIQAVVKDYEVKPADRKININL